MQLKDFDRSMRLHFWAPFILYLLVTPHMRANGGRIVNISSIGGKIAVPHMAAYSASKFALTGFSDAIRAELARDNILVTTVTPGLMRTGSQVHAKFKAIMQPNTNGSIGRARFRSPLFRSNALPEKS
jgi:NAD(P)-dependent dehydrogenase (short-subunit alcohol dehydrogenase family)